MILFACKDCSKTYEMSEIARDEGGPAPGAYRCPVNRDHHLFMSLAPELPITYDSIPVPFPTILSVDVAPFLERAADNPYFRYLTNGGQDSITACYWCGAGAKNGKPDHWGFCLHLKAKSLLGR